MCASVPPNFCGNDGHRRIRCWEDLIGDSPFVSSNLPRQLFWNIDILVTNELHLRSLINLCKPKRRFREQNTVRKKNYRFSNYILAEELTICLYNGHFFHPERLASHSLTILGGLYNFRAKEELMTDMELSATITPLISVRQRKCTC